jgi:hypothetical protein
LVSSGLFFMLQIITHQNTCQNTHAKSQYHMVCSSAAPRDNQVPAEPMRMCACFAVCCSPEPCHPLTATRLTGQVTAASHAAAWLWAALHARQQHLLQTGRDPAAPAEVYQGACCLAALPSHCLLLLLLLQLQRLLLVAGIQQPS